jgi:hypothetical protein
MKKKTLAMALMLSLTGYAVMAQNDSIPKNDSIPSKDTIPSPDTAKITNATAFNFKFVQVRDTVPKSDSMPAPKDSSTAFNFHNHGLNFFTQNDTIPKKDTTKTDTSLVFNLNENARAVAISMQRRDTVPNDSDSTKKDSTLALAQENSFNTPLMLLKNDQQEFAMKREQSAAIKQKKIS